MAALDHAYSSLAGTGAVLLLLSWLVYAVTVAFYRLVLHPLAGFPGPRLAAATRLYEAYYDFWRGGRYMPQIRELHRQYGPLVRISPDEVHLSDPAFYEQLYRQDGRWHKSAFAYGAFGADEAAICTVDHERHRQRRAALNPFFSKAAVATRLPSLQPRVDQLGECIASYARVEGRVLNLGVAFAAMTADISTEQIFGISYRNLERDDFNEGMVDLNQQAGSMWHGTKHVPYYKHLMGALMMLMGALGQVPPGMKAFFAFHAENSKRILQIHRDHYEGVTDSQAPPNLIEHLLRSKLPEDEKSIPRIMQEGHTIVGAGLETVAHTLRIITFWVYSTPGILAKLRAEIRASQEVNDSDAARLKHLEQLPYLTAVIMEGIRFNPGIVTRQARIAPDRDLVYNNWTIPAGTPVGMTPWLMHHDESIFPDPTAFDPERWMDAARRHRLEKTFGPFSRGTRNCLGMHLAWAEMYLTVAMVVSRFDFKMAGTQASDIECETDQFTAGTKTKRGLKVTVRQVGA